jgi:hypothetical protein
MDQNLINMLATGFGAIFGWLLKVVWDSIRSLEQDLKILERDLHTKYVTKDEYRQDILEMKDILKQIFDKLDRKADK